LPTAIASLSGNAGGTQNYDLARCSGFASPLGVAARRSPAIRWGRPSGRLEEHGATVWPATSLPELPFPKGYTIRKYAEVRSKAVQSLGFRGDPADTAFHPFTHRASIAVRASSPVVAERGLIKSGD
jgi:hypothetical protein